MIGRSAAAYLEPRKFVIMTLDLVISTLTPEERVAEKNRILKILESLSGSNNFSERELDFMSDMEDATRVSPKQLKWLRDIKEKYLE